MLYLIFITVFLNFASAEIILNDTAKIKIGGQHCSWYIAYKNLLLESLKTKMTDKSQPVDCKMDSDLEGTAVCLFPTKEIMGQYLGRASAYIEGMGKSNGTGEIKAGILLPPDSVTLRKYQSSMGGYDLKGEDLLKYYYEVEKACQQNEKMCMRIKEKEIFGALVPRIQRNPEFVIIAARYGSEETTQRILHHELCHAYYFKNSQFRDAIKEFWNELSGADKENIKKVLRNSYDITNEYLLLNELQAILLSQPISKNQKKLFEKYSQNFINFMNQKQVPLYQFTYQNCNGVKSPNTNEPSITNSTDSFR